MGGKPRVLHIVTKMVVCGGASRSVGLIAEHQNDPSYPFEVAVALGTPEDGEAELRLPEHIPQYRIADLVRQPSPYHDLRALRQIRKVIREYRPSVVHTHSSKAGVLGRWVARREGVPAVVHHVRGWSFHEGTGALSRRLYLGLERVMAQHCDALLFVARSDLDIAKQLGIGRDDARHVVRSGIQVDEFAPVTPERRQWARRALGIEDGAFVIGTVGQLRPQKAPLDFVRVAQRVGQRVPSARFVWIGDGPMHSQVAGAAGEAGLGDRLLLAGSRQGVGDLLPAFDVFLMTSLWEGLPRAVVEASMVGLPIVATALPGTREVITHQETGLLAEPGDVAGLAEQVLRLYEAPRMRAELATKAAQSSRWEFSIQKTVQDLAELYGQIVSNSSRKGASLPTD